MIIVTENGLYEVYSQNNDGSNFYYLCKEILTHKLHEGDTKFVARGIPKPIILGVPDGLDRHRPYFINKEEIIFFFDEGKDDKRSALSEMAYKNWKEFFPELYFVVK